MKFYCWLEQKNIGLFVFSLKSRYDVFFAKYLNNHENKCIHAIEKDGTLKNKLRLSKLLNILFHHQFSIRYVFSKTNGNKTSTTCCFLKINKMQFRPYVVVFVIIFSRVRHTQKIGKRIMSDLNLEAIGIGNSSLETSRWGLEKFLPSSFFRFYQILMSFKMVLTEHFQTFSFK